MNDKYLLRDDAPIEPDTWKLLDATMVEAARSVLVARRVLPIEGPYGFGLKSIPLEDIEIEEEIHASSAIPLSHIATPFSISKRDLAAYEREHLPMNLNPLIDAAIRAAEHEDKVLLQGCPPPLPGLLCYEGIYESRLSAWDDLGTAANDAITGVTLLDKAGFHGPYAIVLSPARYDQLYRRHPIGAFSELEQMQTIATEGVFKAPVLESGGLIINTGRIYASIALGQDMTIAFIGPTTDMLEFAIVESLALVVRRPGAILSLTEERPRQTAAQERGRRPSTSP
jgi:uncharacterized linocin/CFP29 family protein